MMTLLPEWVRRRRISRGIGYTLISGAGMCSIVWHPPAVKAAVSSLFAVYYLWSGLLIVGGVTSAIDSFRGRWLGEYIGLWPLIVSFLAFSLAVGSNGQGGSAIAGTLLLAGFGVWLFGRWQDVAFLRRESDLLVRRRRK
jgi:hypothetical protein